MKLNRWLVFTAIIMLSACQSATSPTITIVEGDNVITLQTDERVPAAILAQAGLTLDALDRVLVNGIPASTDQSLPKADPITLQIRRPVEVVLNEPRGQIKLVTAAFTVGEALAEASYQIHQGDKVDPPPNSPIAEGMTITLISPSTLSVSVDGRVVQIQSSARTVGEALAEAGIPLLGLDYSLPAENEALPSDGQIKVVRVSESVLLAQKPIPFGSEFVASADVPLDQTQILQPGESGLTVQRIRIRHEDGKEISRITEDETLVRPPRDRILGYGTKIEIKTTVVDGVTIEYWRAVQMYATSYSPCRSGTDKCYPGTSSGKKLAKGMVGLRYSWYLNMQGQRLFIPGYGFASVEDVCGGCVGRPWIDLGYSDEDWQQWSSWVTVYFLTPVPPNVIYLLE